jgi:hypothetical protein
MAEPSAKMIKELMKNKAKIMGISHAFFLILINFSKSRKQEIIKPFLHRLGISVKANFYYPK